MLDFISKNWLTIGTAFGWIITTYIAYLQWHKKHELDALPAVTVAASGVTESQKDLIERLDARLARQDERIEQLESELRAERINLNALQQVVAGMKAVDADKDKIISDLRKANKTLLELNKRQQELIAERDTQIDALKKQINDVLDRIKILENHEQLARTNKRS